MTKLFLLLVAAAACGGKTAPPPIANQASVTPVGLDRSIRAIDWRNRSYNDVAVVDGQADLLYDAQDNEYTQAAWNARYPGQDPIARGWVMVSAPVYTDVDHDGSEDAVIATTMNTGGSGNFDSIDLYALRAGAPVVIASIPGGDRADGGIAGIDVDSTGDILVERYVNLGDGACCPTASQHEVWRWTSGAISEDVARRTGPAPLAL